MFACGSLGSKRVACLVGDGRESTEAPLPLDMPFPLGSQSNPEGVPRHRPRWQEPGAHAYDGMMAGSGSFLASLSMRWDGNQPAK